MIKYQDKKDTAESWDGDRLPIILSIPINTGLATREMDRV